MKLSNKTTALVRAEIKRLELILIDTPNRATQYAVNRLNDALESCDTPMQCKEVKRAVEYQLSITVLDDDTTECKQCGEIEGYHDEGCVVGHIENIKQEIQRLDRKYNITFELTATGYTLIVEDQYSESGHFEHLPQCIENLRDL